MPFSEGVPTQEGHPFSHGQAAIVSRAREILKKLETQAPQAAPRPAPEDDAQVSMLDMGAGELRRALEAVTVETLTPIEAMNVLYKLKQML